MTKLLYLAKTYSYSSSGDIGLEVHGENKSINGFVGKSEDRNFLSNSVRVFTPIEVDTEKETVTFTAEDKVIQFNGLTIN